MSSTATSMIAAVLCLAACCMHAVNACGETLLAQNFDSHTEGWQTWKRSTAEKDFPVGLKYLKGSERASVGEGALRIKHPAGGVGPGGTGMLMRVDLPREVSSATLSYRVKFDANYDWTAGGKLPGLCDSDCPTGCKDMNKFPGWSSRIMFREGGLAESYMYYPNMKDFGTCGKSYETTFHFSSDQWHEVKLFIKLNTDGQSNGVQKVWIDGNEVLSKTDFKFRPGDGNLIKQLKFENFHGGKSAVFKPSKTQHVQFDDFMVQEGDCSNAGSTLFTESDGDEDLLGGAPEAVRDSDEDEVYGTDGDGTDGDGTDGDGSDGDGSDEDGSDGDPVQQLLSTPLGRMGAPGGQISSDDSSNDDQSDVAGAKDEGDNKDHENDNMIDDDENDSDPDCGDKDEEVCTHEQIKKHDRKYECDHGYMNNGKGVCVDYKE